MRARTLTYLNGLSACAAIVFFVLGSTSYFSIASLGYRWESDEAQSRCWLGCGSRSCQLLLFYRHESKSYDDYLTGLQLKVPGANVPAPKLGWTAQFLPHRLAPRWWFEMNHNTTASKLPTTGPNYVPGSSGTAFSIRRTSIAVPYWILVLLTGTPPLYRLIDLPNRLRRKRFAAGQCTACGYDLRHSPERCPECGVARTTSPPPPYDAIGRIIAVRREKWWQISLYPIALAIYLFTFWRILYSHL